MLRPVIGLLLVCLAVGLLKSRAESSAAAAPRQPRGGSLQPTKGSRPVQQWRRTVRGWEELSEWEMQPHPSAPRIAAVHPGLVAILQLLLSVAALLSLTPNRGGVASWKAR